MRRINEAGLNLIKSFEGCRLTAYKPVASEKYWTIGWGHYGADVKEGQTITQSKADELLRADLSKYEAYVSNQYYCQITNSLTDNQFSALVSFCYNCGSGGLKTLCNNRNATQISNAMLLYNKAGGKVLAGLVRRRKAEQELFNKKDDKDEEEVKMDNTPSSWAKSAVEKAIKEGIIQGDGNGNLDLHEAVTLEKLLVILERCGALK